MAKVIVWTQAYNAEKTLRRAMDSILQQTYPDLEYYVLDNGSADRTGEIIAEYAKEDPRVIPLRRKENSLFATKEFLPDIFRKLDAEWFVWCDADDRYDTTFLEKMVRFAETNHLDVAACGYRQIDGQTEEVLKERTIEQPLIITGDGFHEKFVEYRGFIVGFWGRVIKTSIVKEIWQGFWINSSNTNKMLAYSDCSFSMKCFKAGKRCGIYPEAMYDYYQYNTSLIHTTMAVDLEGYTKYYYATEEYIKSFGPISKRNQAFLYAIYLSLFEEAFQKMESLKISPDKKIAYLEQMLDKQELLQALSHKNQGEFRILKFKGQLIGRVREYLLQLKDMMTDHTPADQVLHQLDTLWTKANA